MSKASSVANYLAELPADRRETIAAVRALILKHLPAGYRESIAWGMIGYGVPLDRYPDTYNGQPLCYAGLATQKNFNTLYLNMAYADSKVESALKAAYAKAGKKLDMGKSCLRFRSMADLLPTAVAAAIASTPVAEFIAISENNRRSAVKPRKASGEKSEPAKPNAAVAGKPTTTRQASPAKGKRQPGPAGKSPGKSPRTR